LAAFAEDEPELMKKYLALPAEGTVERAAAVDQFLKLVFPRPQTAK
jgi:hypothetical protein